MAVSIILLIAGFGLLIFGANYLVSGASALAKKKGVSDLAIGLTIVAFGTSAPELVVNLVASIQGSQDIVLGNVIGSNIFNLFLILGIAGMISPLVVQSSTIWKEIPISLFAVIILWALANLFGIRNSASISRVEGLLLLCLFVSFLYYVYRQFKADPVKNISSFVIIPDYKIWLYIIGGLAGLVVGGRLSVTGATSLAEMLGVSERIIGLTVIAAGTSLPELATSVIAAIKKNNDIAIGNVIGSNIFNIFFILGSSAVVRPVLYNPAYNTDLYILAGGTLLLFVAMFTGKQKKLDRWEAVVLFAIFTAYLWYII